MTINQSVVSSNIRGLQGRTHKRGITLAALEARRTAVKTAIKALRNIGYPVDSVLLDNRDLLNRLVKESAVSQTLDRQLLKQQYALQAAVRPSKAYKEPRPNRDPRKVFAVGDVIVALTGESNYFLKGTKATLLRRDDGDSTWLADFNHPDNKQGSYHPGCDGRWWIREEVMAHAPSV